MRSALPTRGALYRHTAATTDPTESHAPRTNRDTSCPHFFHASFARARPGCALHTSLKRRS